MATLRIKEIAMAQGFTQETLAFKSGVKMRTVQRLWQDKIPHPRTEVMIKIAGVLKVPVQELYTEDGLKSALENIQMLSHAGCTVTWLAAWAFMLVELCLSLDG